MIVSVFVNWNFRGTSVEGPHIMEYLWDLATRITILSTTETSFEASTKTTAGTKTQVVGSDFVKGSCSKAQAHYPGLTKRQRDCVNGILDNAQIQDRRTLVLTQTASLAPGLIIPIARKEHGHDIM